MNNGLLGAAVALLALFAVARTAEASSPAAWDEFRAGIRAKCVAAAKRHLTRGIHVRVDPFGSESYGLALVTGYERHSTTPSQYLCVVGKRSGKAEIGGATEYYVK